MVIKDNDRRIKKWFGSTPLEIRAKILTVWYANRQVRLKTNIVIVSLDENAESNYRLCIR